MVGKDVNLDFERFKRIGISEAILCEGKSISQIGEALENSIHRPILLTRLEQNILKSLPDIFQKKIDYDSISRTGFFGKVPVVKSPPQVVIVTAGTSDTPASREAARTLQFHGEDPLEVTDIGVAGIWRLLDRIDDISSFRVAIVAAGMDAALASVIGGLMSSIIIGLPTSTGYGAAEGGRTALNAMLTSCAPGIAVVNLDNGYGAACIALRALNQIVSQSK